MRVAKPFSNSTKLGSEKAIRKGQNVPDGDVNIAYFKAPKVSPKNNLLIVDTSRAIEENISDQATGCEVLYANEYGVLTDINGNAAFTDSSPAISDEFLREEDYSIEEGTEYKASDVLPFVHVSRYFHVDLAGLAIAGQQTPYANDKVKVVDSKGQEYPNHKIKIVPASIKGYALRGETWAYRILAFVDSNSREDLYLQYHKTEIDEEGRLTNRLTDYREILNPLPFFERVPEEADVVDPSSYRKKIFSSAPIAEKDREIGLIDNSNGGHKIFVPKKAIPDPRIYQLFRWRIRASFVKDSVVEDSPDTGTIKCGVLATDNDIASGGFIPDSYALANLESSRYNSSRVTFENPKNPNGEKQTADYWLVNLDKDDLSEYDFLIWTPKNRFEDISKYTAKLRAYTKVHGGTLFFDTKSLVDAYDYFGGELSQPVKAWSGANRPAENSPITGSVSVNEEDVVLSSDHILLNANKDLGGWDIDSTSAEYMSYFQFPETNRYAQFFDTDPAGFDSVISSGGKSLVVASEASNGEGNIILSTMGILTTCSATFDYVDNSVVTAHSAPFGTSNYELNISGAGVEGAMKLLYNAMLLSLKNKIAREDDETSFSTSWVYESDWKSSWVINAFDGVLSDKEKQENSFFIDARDPLDGDFKPVWKRKLSDKTIEEIVDEGVASTIRKNPALRERIKGSTIQYEMEVTNPEVETPATIVEKSLPVAWTQAYSPAFKVPETLGPHIVKEVVDSDGIKGIRPDYSSDVLSYLDYPDQPYSGRVRALNAETQEYIKNHKVNYTATGTAKGKFKVTRTKDVAREVAVEKTVEVTKTIDTSKTVEVVKELSWAEARSGTGSAIKEGSLFKTTSFPKGFIRPVGIRTWQDYNYFSNDFGPGNLLWPYMGFQSRIKKGSSGNSVKFVQEAFNRFAAAGYFSQSKLKVDGDYGTKTESAVTNFQKAIGANFVDGVIDAESWWLIFAWVNRLEKDGKLGDNYLNYFDNGRYIRQERLSDGNPKTYYAKRSWNSGGPKTVWDLIAVTFDKRYRIEKVSITPYLIGEAQNLLFQSVHVKDGNNLKNYDADASQLRHMNKRIDNGKKYTLSVGPYEGDTIVLGIAQDAPYKKGSTSRFLGVSEVTAHARIYKTESGTRTVTENQTVIDYETVIEQQEYITEVTEEFTFEVTGSISVDASSDKSRKIQLRDIPEKYESVSDIVFDSIVDDNAEVLSSITSSGLATFSTQVVADNYGTNVTEGPSFPSGLYYAKTPSGYVSPRPETGWVNKSEGIKLLCDADGDPYGFPALPTSAGDELTRHNVSLSLFSEGSGPEVYLSFYDAKEQEFVTTPGEKRAELSYIDYINRGPQNIYIAVLSEFEVSRQEVLPDDADAPRLPYKRAMPAYGVCSSKGVDIALEETPHNLGIKDVWPIAIRAGQFTRDVEIMSKQRLKLNGLLSKFQGSTVECTYAVPEALIDQGSKRFGPRVEDVKDETPSIESDKVLRVRQAPIHMARHTTNASTKADPVRPVLTLYKRATASSPWVEVPRSEIADINTSTGEIFLKTPLSSLDDKLIKVDYSTDRPFYDMKKTKSGQTVNLNVFANQMPDYVNKPIYVYMVPHYFKNEAGDIVPESINTKTIDITSNKDIFNPLSPQYDPLAVQLGVIYQSTSSNINDLALFDTRRRGGGAKDELASKELARIVDDALSYWDIDYGSGTSYPKQGFVLVRVPEAALQHIEKERVREIVAQNMTAGVAFDLVFDA